MANISAIARIEFDPLRKKTTITKRPIIHFSKTAIAQVDAQGIYDTLLTTAFQESNVFEQEQSAIQALIIDSGTVECRRVHVILFDAAQTEIRSLIPVEYWRREHRDWYNASRLLGFLASLEYYVNGQGHACGLASDLNWRESGIDAIFQQSSTRCEIAEEGEDWDTDVVVRTKTVIPHVRDLFRRDVHSIDKNSF